MKKRFFNAIKLLKAHALSRKTKKPIPNVTKEKVTIIIVLSYLPAAAAAAAASDIFLRSSLQTRASEDTSTDSLTFIPGFSY